jgi:hypothetical protein
MTYHAVENYLRKFRKEAKNMMAGQPSGGDASPAVTPAKASSARKRKAESPAKNGKGLFYVLFLCFLVFTGAPRNMALTCGTSSGEDGPRHEVEEDACDEAHED